MINIKEILNNIPLYVYAQLNKNKGRIVFENYELYIRAFYRKGIGTVVLHTRDGLSINIRQNIWDARIVREIFFDKPYIRYFTIPPNSTVVDIGGYIGDFSVYAVKYLNAAKVIVYEPTVENFEILKLNIECNGYSDQIVAVNKAVSSSDEVTLNVQTRENEEVHASTYWYQEEEKRKIPSITLSDLFEEHKLGHIDLLKVDCEGCEYDIFSDIPSHIYDRIMNIVFEYHHIEGFKTKLEMVLKRLQYSGYKLRKDKNIVYASRAENFQNR